MLNIHLQRKETQHIGMYQSKKYDEIIKELQDIKQDNVITDTQPSLNIGK